MTRGSARGPASSDKTDGLGTQRLASLARRRMVAAVASDAGLEKGLPFDPGAIASAASTRLNRTRRKLNEVIDARQTTPLVLVTRRKGQAHAH